MSEVIDVNECNAQIEKIKNAHANAVAVVADREYRRGLDEAKSKSWVKKEAMQAGILGFVVGVIAGVVTLHVVLQ